MSKPSEKFSPFRWNPAREKAAALLASPDQTSETIGKAVGVTARQIDNWRAHPDFRVRVAEHVAAQTAAIQVKGIAARENRVAAYNDRWERMQRLLAARAAGMGQDEIEGGDTGLLVRKVKTVQLLNGVSITRTEAFEYELDAALLREMRELEKQAAMEVGQWTEKNQNTTEVIIREYGGFDASKV